MGTQHMLKEIRWHLVVLLVCLVHQRRDRRLIHAAGKLVQMLRAMRLGDLDLAHPLPAERPDTSANDRVGNPSPLYGR